MGRVGHACQCGRMLFYKTLSLASRTCNSSSSASLNNSPTPLTQNPYFCKCRKCRISPPSSTLPPFLNYYNITYTYLNRFKFLK
ncbi:hypothetical protein LY76DRAFT_382602 [Colletotrichum caudatum]|nr:hypothetical protein LY76DRAFT_382602 [Colletotrichum caudatum]